MAELIRMPPAEAAEGQAGLVQIQRYLFQMAEQLNFVLGSMDKQVETVQKTMKVTVKQEVAGAAKSPQATFNEVKSLIIKSADIVDSYFETISKKLEGHYVAVSEYGTFVEDATNEIRANANGITQIYTNLQSINGSVAEIRDQQMETNAYIKTGLVGTNEDGTPAYGLEIGQETTLDGVTGFKHFSRFTANRLSFYDANGNEVAYVTNKVLYIDEADVQLMVAKEARISQLMIGEYTITAGADGHLSLM